jgi:hypothetical protein
VVCSSIDQATGLAVMPLISTREVPRSNTGVDAGYRYVRFNGYTQSLHINSGVVSSLDPDRFLSNHFQFIICRSSYHRRCNLVTGRIREYSARIKEGAKNRIMWTVLEPQRDEELNSEQLLNGTVHRILLGKVKL